MSLPQNLLENLPKGVFRGAHAPGAVDLAVLPPLATARTPVARTPVARTAHSRLGAAATQGATLPHESTGSKDALSHDALSHDALSHDALSHDALPRSALPLDWPELNAALPDGGFLRGAVTELAVSGGAACATTMALSACRSAQQGSAEQAWGFTQELSSTSRESAELRVTMSPKAELQSSVPWCAFVDPSASLHAPGVAQLGVKLQNLLVVRPSLEALGAEAVGRVALRLIESRAFAVVVVDLLGVPGSIFDTSEFEIALGNWPRIIRRLSIAVGGTNTCALLLTSREAPRPLPLPVAMRIELERQRPGSLTLRVAKDKWGRISRHCHVPLRREQAAAAVQRLAVGAGE